MYTSHSIIPQYAPQHQLALRYNAQGVIESVAATGHPALMIARARAEAIERESRARTRVILWSGAAAATATVLGAALYHRSQQRH